MRRVVWAGAVSLVAVVATALPARANPGDLDPHFGGTGHVSAVVPGNQDGVAVVVRPSGRVAVVAENGTVAQFLANGDPDTGFGSGGVVDGPPNVSITAAALDSLGKLLLAGSLGSNFFVERLLPNGDPDPSFGGGGSATTAFARFAYADAVTVGPHGRIVVAGGVGISASRFAVARYLDGGKLDRSFSDDGKVTTEVLGNDYGSDVVVADDGSVVVAGSVSASDTSPRSFGVVRYRPNGHIDRTFSGDGKAIVRMGTTSDPVSLLIQPNGAIVVGGNYYRTTGIDWALARFTPGGKLDRTFSADGKVTTVISPGTDIFAGLVRQQSGDLIAAGTHQDVGEHSVVLVRYLANGKIDSGFGIGGRVTEDFGDHPSSRGIARSPHAKVVIGTTVDGAGTDGDLGAARFLAGP